MKDYTLKVYLNESSITENITAETHSIENGVYIFWVRNDKDEWCQIAMYPVSCTAITRIKQSEGFAIARKSNDIATFKGNSTLDIEDVVMQPLPSSEPVKKRSKK